MATINSLNSINSISLSNVTRALVTLTDSYPVALNFNDVRQEADVLIASGLAVDLSDGFYLLKATEIGLEAGALVKGEAV
jgi:hypothetical protein